MRTHWIAVFCLGVMLAGCSSDDDESTESAESSAAALKAPMLMKCMPMEGALHLYWMNVQADCDTVEGERMMHGGEYELGFSVPGSVDNKMDVKATEDMMYTYRLRCKKGERYSPFSNVMSANPTEEEAMMDAGGSE